MIFEVEDGHWGYSMYSPPKLIRNKMVWSHKIETICIFQDKFITTLLSYIIIKRLYATQKEKLY